MSSPIRYREGDTYLQVRPDPSYSYKLRVIKSTQRCPDVLEPGCVLVKIKLRVPHAAFLPLTPEAVVTVPDSFVQQRIDVEATEPDAAP
jgi:hypothetical protein